MLQRFFSLLWENWKSHARSYLYLSNPKCSNPNYPLSSSSITTGPRQSYTNIDFDFFKMVVQPNFSSICKGAPDVIEKILLNLPTVAIMRSRRVSREVFNIISNSKRIWKKVFQKLRRRNFLVDPVWVQIRDSYLEDSLETLCLKIMDYSRDPYDEIGKTIMETTQIINYRTFRILYGNLRRIQAFWPKMRNLDHPPFVLALLKALGQSEEVEFLRLNMPASSLADQKSLWDYWRGL